MDSHLKRLTLALAGAALATLAACGGGGGGAAAPVAVSEGVDVTVVDGPIKNAVVCLDKNLNGACEADEPQGRTNSAGKIRLAVTAADAAQYPVLAVVGADAEDMDEPGVAIDTPYTMTSPVGKPNLVNPLTSMVSQNMQTGATLAQAEATVQEMVNIRVSLFDDYTGKAAPTDGSANPAHVARMVVVATQAQIKAVAGALGTTNPLDNAKISQTDINKIVAQKVLQMLPAILAIVQDPANADKATIEAALKTALAPSGSLNTQLLSTAAVQTAVAVNNQQAIEAAAPMPAYVATAGITLDTLNFTDASNWSSRILGNSLAGGALDADGLLRIFDRRARSNQGAIANWNFGNNPQDQSILHWTGSAWESCALNFEFKVTLRDANGNNKNSYCNNYSTGSSNRVGFNVSGKTMASVYAQIRNAGYTNLTITDSLANATALLGSDTFPAESTIFYVTNTRLTSAYAYNPGSGAVVVKNKNAAGGDGRTGTSPTCNGAAPNSNVTSLEDMVATFKGEPCLFNQQSITSVNGTFQSPNPIQAQGASTLSLGITLGNVVLSSPATAFYTGNKIIRVSFAGAAANATTYYACDQQFGQGFTHQCTSVGTGTYSIITLPDGARALTFANLPTQTATLGNNRVFIERNGVVYFGFKDKLNVTNLARFNSKASDALLAKLGMPAVDPQVQPSLTAASYQGTWDMRIANTPFSFSVGTRVVIAGNNAVTCFNNVTGAASTCTGTVTNPLTGAFSYTNSTGSAQGSFDFITGTATGTYTDSALVPATGNLTGQRR